MPQLDFTTYSSQIFWFLICFVTLFIFASKVILPRISKIIADRQNIIDSDLKSCAILKLKIDNLQIEAKKLREKASQEYKDSLEEITKNNNQERQELVEKTKEELEKTIENSRNKIKEFITASEQKSQSAIAELTIKIREKLVKNV